MKIILLTLMLFLLTGCAEKELVIKTDIKYIDICSVDIPDNLLKKEEIKFFPTVYNEKEIKKFISELYFTIKENQFKIDSINEIYNRNKKQKMESNNEK